ncbi:hypothetical protein HD554DRAFT_2042276 [Boletus coccyginus]|nr:hypothetical protein HD554DRAFT_2042276 [Boletus coccyginus]
MSDLASFFSYLQQVTFCQGLRCHLLYLYLIVLTFDSEVDLIWAREWNQVTLLYAIVRYLSFFLTLSGRHSLESGMKLTDSGLPTGLAWYQIRMWGPYVFRFAMDIIMMKRIYALSHRPSGFLSSPKWVLATMVTAFVVKNAVSITFLLLAIGPSSDVTSAEFSELGTHVCGTYMSKTTLLVSAQFPTLAFEALLFSLALGYFVSDVWGYWRSQESNNWKMGDLMQILVRDSTIYFAIITVAMALNVVNYSLHTPNFLPYCFAPRLVINMKEFENRVHMSGFSEELSDIRFLNEGYLPQVRQMDDFA